MRRLTVTVTTEADGTGSGLSGKFTGKIVQIEYVKPASGGFDSGVDFAITGEATGIGLWSEANVNDSTIRAPRQPTHAQDGSALLHAAGGTAVATQIGLSNDRVKIAIASGGNAKIGVFHVTVE